DHRVLHEREGEHRSNRSRRRRGHTGWRRRDALEPGATLLLQLSEDTMLDDIVKDAKDSMDKAIDALKKNLATIRTGRANPSMLDSVKVDYYDTPTPLNHV